jgi:hypothetical protein
MTTSSSLEVSGALVLSYLASLVNLKILAGDHISQHLSTYKVGEWYPLSEYLSLFKVIEEKFQDTAPIKESVGAESMRIWYDQGPGREIITKGVDFLRFQTSSEGYHSVVRGDVEEKGNFQLQSIDEDRGTAVVVSSTPLDRDMERGVLLGGLNLCGDLDYVEVNNDENPNVFKIEFH